MRKLLLLVLFVLLNLYSFTQTNIQQDNRVSLALKQAVFSQSGYSTYGRTGRFINIAVVNQSSHIISWFTCHGRLFDSTRLDDREYKQLTTKQLDPFELYQNICDKYLADLAAAKDIYRVYGGNQLLDRLPGNYRALFAMENVQAAKTPLQKLMAIENVRKKILTQLALLNCVNPASLHVDPLYRVNKEQAGVMVQTKDSTVYYNIDPTSAVTKISLYTRSPEKLYVQNRLGEVTDSVSLLPVKNALLQKEKTDVFLLYRGWLEMQWQIAMGGIRSNIAEYRQVNLNDESYRQLNAIRSKINLLISPEAKCIEQAVYDTYRSETSEMYYIPLLGISYNLVQTRGLKEYELSNHLGNVLVTISDKKNGVSSSANSSLIDHYEPDIVSAQDYYPFGMLQPGRSLSTGDKYRYGFNGKENDNEVKGEGNQQDYGMRVYDPRLGKFLSVDPLTKQYPELTPYQFASNRVIDGIDRDGKEYEGYGSPMGGMDDYYTIKEMTKAGYSQQEALNFIKNTKIQTSKAGAYGVLTGAVVVADVYLCQGKISYTIMGMQFAGAAYHNRAKTPEGRAQQEKASRAAFSDALIGWGFGKIIGIAFSASIAAYEGNMIIQRTLKDGVKVIVAQTEDDIAYLKSMNSKALYMGGDGKEGSILITEGAPRSHLLEEAIHHEQRMMYGDKKFYANQAEMEVEAQDKLLKIGQKEGWSKEEMDELKKAREHWMKELEKKKE